MTGERDEMANNLAKLTSIDNRKSEVQRHLAREHRNLTKKDDTEILSDIEIERQARLETLSTNRATLRSQINRIRETFRRLLHEDTTLAERICTLFREQAITIASILTAISMAISTLVLALTGGGESAPAPAPKPPDKSCLKEWVKKHLQVPGRAGNLSWHGRCGPARYYWLNYLLASGHVGKDCDLARRKFVGIGHC